MNQLFEMYKESLGIEKHAMKAETILIAGRNRVARSLANTPKKTYDQMVRTGVLPMGSRTSLIKNLDIARQSAPRELLSSTTREDPSLSLATETINKLFPKGGTNLKTHIRKRGLNRIMNRYM